MKRIINFELEDNKQKLKELRTNCGTKEKLDKYYPTVKESKLRQEIKYHIKNLEAYYTVKVNDIKIKKGKKNV